MFHLAAGPSDIALRRTSMVFLLYKVQKALHRTSVALLPYKVQKALRRTSVVYLPYKALEAAYKFVK